MKDSHYHFWWTQLKNRKFISQLKKHNEVWVANTTTVLKTPEITKKMDTDSDGNKASESGEDTATTPSSIKINK